MKYTQIILKLHTYLVNMISTASLAQVCIQNDAECVWVHICTVYFMIIPTTVTIILCQMLAWLVNN